MNPMPYFETFGARIVRSLPLVVHVACALLVVVAALTVMTTLLDG